VEPWTTLPLAGCTIVSLAVLLGRGDALDAGDVVGEPPALDEHAVRPTRSAATPRATRTVGTAVIPSLRSAV
jgi:hypothetical protein